MPIEPAPPKYATIVNVLQARIEAGLYPVGAMLPSEAQLVREFAAARGTVVRALEYLRQLGFIEGVQGVGRVVLGRPVTRPPRSPDRVRGPLHAVETTASTLIGAGRAPAPPRIAACLAIPVGEPVIARQRLMPTARTDVLMLNTAYLPAVMAAGTALQADEPLREGVLDHLERRRQLIAQDVMERLSARPPSAREATLLGIDRNTCLLAILLIARDGAGHPLLVLDLVIPVTPQGIEDVFPVR